MRLLLPTLIAAAIVTSSGVQVRARADDAPTPISSRRQFSKPQQPSEPSEPTMADLQNKTTPVGPPVVELPRQDAQASSGPATNDHTTTKSDTPQLESQPRYGSPSFWIRDPIGT